MKHMTESNFTKKVFNIIDSPYVEHTFKAAMTGFIGALLPIIAAGIGSILIWTSYRDEILSGMSLSNSKVDFVEAYVFTTIMIDTLVKISIQFGFIFLAGYLLFFLIFPSFLRRWKRPFIYGVVLMSVLLIGYAGLSKHTNGIERDARDKANIEIWGITEPLREPNQFPADLDWSTQDSHHIASITRQISTLEGSGVKMPYVFQLLVHTERDEFEKADYVLRQGIKQLRGQELYDFLHKTQKGWNPALKDTILIHAPFDERIYDYPLFASDATRQLAADCYGRIRPWLVRISKPFRNAYPSCS